MPEVARGTTGLVLVDSSAWIAALRSGGEGSSRVALDTLLADRGAATCPVIVTELLQGAISARGLEALADELRWLPLLSMEQAGEPAGRAAWHLRRQGITVPTTDLLIAATALVHGARLMHQDRHLRLIAQALGVETLEPEPASS